MKWFYLGNMGVLANEDQSKELENHCNTKGPEDLKKFEHVSFCVIKKMINEAKVAVKAENEEVKEEKPKRKRRTKAEIEADNAGK